MAVAVHPPLSRGSQRAVSTAASEPASVSSATTSVASRASTSNTASAPATLVSDRPLNQSSPPPPLPFGTAAPTGPTRASTVSTVPQNGVNPRQTTANTADRRSTRVHTPAHMRPQQFHAPPHTHRGDGNGNTNGNGGSSSGGPLASTAVPHAFAATYASSPFFQRVTDTAPMPQSSPDAPRAAASTASANAKDEENSMLQLQDVTPITNAGDSKQESQLLSQLRATAESGCDSGHYSHRQETADHDGSAGVTPAVSSATANTAPLQSSPFTGAHNAFVAGGIPPWSTLPYAQPQPCPMVRVLAHQQSVFFPCECNTSQCMAAKPFSQSTSPSDTARLCGTPGGLSTSQSVTMCSTGQRRSRGAVSVAAANGTAMSSACPLTSPESVSGHLSGIYASPPPSSSQAYASGRDQCCSPLPTPGSTRRRCQKTGTAVISSPAYAHVPHQHHLFLQHYGVDGVSGYGSRGGPLMPSSPNLTVTPLSMWASVPEAACAATTAMAAADQGRTSASAGTSTAQGASGGASDFSAIARGLSGVALQKQLLYASKGELTRILLELASCNPEASRFIHSKAFFFAFRHEHGGEAVEACEECPAATPVTTAAAAAANKNGQHYALHGGLGSGFTSRTVDTPERDRSFEQSGVLKRPVAGAGTLSGAAAAYDHVIARCIFPVEAADDEDGDGDGAGDDSVAKIEHSDPTVTKGAANATMPRRCLYPEDRAFSAELHPCLRWYGACRNATSCVYANVPRNVCLSWIRGSCMADTGCSGVHRLPSPCPPEIRRIYELNHGLARRDTPVNACAARVSLGHSLPIPPPFPGCTAQARAPLANGSVAAALPTNPNANAPAAELAEACAGANEALGMCAVMMEGLGGEKVVVHTPTDQSIHKDTFLGGGSTPRRHPHGRDVELCISAMTMMERCGGAHTMTAGDASLWDLSNAAITRNVCGPVDHEMLQYTGGILGADASAGAAAAAAPPCLFGAGVRPGGQRSGVVSSAGNSRCSTAEGCDSRTNSVSRYLGPQFDRAATAVLHRDDGRADSAAMSWATQEQQPDPKKSIKSICGCVCEANEPLQVVPVRPAGGVAGALIDVDDECDFSAPAAGTRTRMQSPLYQ
ncbi:glucoamylase-like protein [Leishmania major strain Friedlin]|uniref:Glucoamylase-like protein n=1 Tax=Leishmania major TaxID=5664 RepID=Q4QBT1_LEIMA|nr:glucoamylase-like protein [Leishmania major strain Friedlin]CAG9573932.1 glucoamylase-like_protein [Leishmania major strain Friedlin]CAJ04248.1 glucoamylase-like protein [Leishmania major strain Friedlin]|eukprot:XP_001683217.1 glucoamylase-like protein [Leishmania major strain Friedlin]